MTRRLDKTGAGIKPGKHKRRPTRRTRLSRHDLLPLPLPQVRALSLEYHMALAAIRLRHGTIETVTCLIRVLYLTYVIGKQVHSEEENAALVAAERTLSSCVDRVVDVEGGKWYLDHAEARIIERVLAMHDAQLANLPKHRYAAAWMTVQDSLSRSESPIADTSFL
jgi:hypothetical protein